jgi:hypothetical protein
MSPTEKPPDDSAYTKVTVRMDQALFRRLKTECARRGIFLQEAVEEAVTRWLRRKSK